MGNAKKINPDVVGMVNTKVFDGKKVLEQTAKTSRGNVVVCEEKDGTTHILTGYDKQNVSAISIYGKSSYSRTEVCRTDEHGNKLDAACGDETGELPDNERLRKGAYNKLIELMKRYRGYFIFINDCDLPSLPEKLKPVDLG